MDRSGGLERSLAIVHHANQYLITNGYENREGLDDLVGSPTSRRGYFRILELHQEFEVPFHLHLSGTLIEALLWYRPDFLDAVRRMVKTGLVQLVGSCYSQHIMRFFTEEFNRKQLDEGLRVAAETLCVDPRDVTVFWPPERVWDTKTMAPILADPALLNGGYRYVLVDDRVLFPIEGSFSRRDFDERNAIIGCEFLPWRIEGGYGLAALPIARVLRYNVPPRTPDSLHRIAELFRSPSENANEKRENRIAICADDMEKVAGVGPWDQCGPDGYRSFLEWIRNSRHVQAVRFDQWLSPEKIAGERPLDTGTYLELARCFGAGEGYERWFLSPEWQPYRMCRDWAEEHVRDLTRLGADAGLIELAWKQLLASSYETAWHTPAYGVHGDSVASGQPSPWAKAVASHSRHAGVIAEAACWMRHKDGRAHACLVDLDNDGELEVVLKNNALFAVIAPRWGGRLVDLFSVSGDSGKLVIGNPCDDWNWMEELNRYMEVPANHPGALADEGFLVDAYSPSILPSQAGVAAVSLVNTSSGSAACGLIKEISLRSPTASSLDVAYTLPDGLSGICIEFGLSPDYLNLLRRGAEFLEVREESQSRGCQAGEISVVINPAVNQRIHWLEACRRFGHGCSLKLAGRQKQIRFSIDVRKGCGPSGKVLRRAARFEPALTKTARLKKIPAQPD